MTYHQDFALSILAAIVQGSSHSDAQVNYKIEDIFFYYLLLNVIIIVVN